MKTRTLTLGILMLGITALSAQTAVNTSTRGTNAWYGGGGHIKPAGLTPALPGGQMSWTDVAVWWMGSWISGHPSKAPTPVETPKADGEAKSPTPVRKN